MLFGKLGLAVLLAGTPLLANIVVNPDFESGLNGWTANGWSIHPLFAHSGTQSVFTACSGGTCITGPAAATLTQTLATSGGQAYTLSFWQRFDVGTPNQLNAYWDGSAVTVLVDQSNSGWQQVVLAGLLATGSSTVLEFRGRSDPAGTYVDNVSVTADLVVPEPAGAFLVLGGLAVLGSVYMRRRSLRLPAAD